MSFEDAQARAAAQNYGSYAAASIEAENAALHKAVVQCAATRRSGSVAYVLEIGENGRIVNVYTDSSNSLTRCVKRVLRRRTLPPPPKAPYFRGGVLHFS